MSADATGTESLLRLDARDLEALNAHRQGAESTRVCHAPEQSLYFGLGGHVYTCCFNKTHRAGVYPEQSIREIWEGAAVRAQRAALEAADLSLGCGGCYSLLKSRNISALPLRAYDALSSDPPGMPSRMEFELFNTCNLECIMCRGEFSSAIRANREKRPPLASPYDERFFEQLEPFLRALRSARFLGGEPLLIPQYVTLWERMTVVNPGVSISIQTNATVLDHRTKAILRRGRFHISVSIDSVDKSLYETIRKNARFERVMENIEWLAAYARDAGTSFGISCCPMPQNWQGLPAVLEFANRSGASLFFTTVEAPAECSLQALPASEIRRVREVLGRFDPKAGDALEAANRQVFAHLLSQLDAWGLAAERAAQEGFVAPPADLAEFLGRIRRLALADAPVETVARRMAEIEDHLRFVLDYAAARGRKSEAEAKMVASPPEVVWRSLPGLSREDVLRLFQSFVLSLD